MILIYFSTETYVLVLFRKGISNEYNKLRFHGEMTKVLTYTLLSRYEAYAKKKKKKKKKNRSKILNHLMYLPIFTRALALHWCLLQYPGMSDLTHNFRALPDSTFFLYKMVNGTRGYYSWFLLNEMFLFIVVFKIWEKFSKHFSFKTLVLLNKLRYHAHF